MKKVTILCVVLIIAMFGCLMQPVPEPERCAICDDISRHAPCLINLITGEKLELEVYEPHPLLVGEIAEEQCGGYFCFVRGAGAEGYKLGAKTITITIPVRSDKMKMEHFCNDCRELLKGYTECGYVLVDLKDTDNPVIYRINTNTSFSLRCYDIDVNEITEDGKYQISVVGKLE